jgi:prepilin-type N-terminal cleavage/methylation domain-containing protein
MDQSKSSNRACRRQCAQRGFTMIEVCVAIAVLTVGLVSVATLFWKVWGGTSYSQYIAQAAVLASEKLEDLNRYPATDPDVAVTSGTTAGSLTSNVESSVTSMGITETVDYYDTVYFSMSGGSVSETVTSGTSPNYTYTTTTHSPNGEITVTSGSSLPASTSETIQFLRRWIIEANEPVSGVRRITVLVSLQNQSIAPDVSFQMSLVRP